MQYNGEATVLTGFHIMNYQGLMRMCKSTQMRDRLNFYHPFN